MKTLHQLARLVIGTTTAPDKSVTHIIKVIRTTFPPINDSFTFAPTANDTNTTNEVETNTNDQTDVKQGAWSTVPGNISRATSGNRTAVIPNHHPINN